MAHKNNMQSNTLTKSDIIMQYHSRHKKRHTKHTIQNQQRNFIGFLTFKKSGKKKPAAKHGSLSCQFLRSVYNK